MSLQAVALVPTVPSSEIHLPALIAGAGKTAARHFLEFFTVNIRNTNTRAAYARAAAVFLQWSAPTVKQHLACIRMLFDWLVIGQVIPLNPAHSVRGPRHSVSKGATRCLLEEASALLESIAVAKKVNRYGMPLEDPLLVGLRDRALIGVMTYTFARVGAVVALAVEDYYPQNKRWWLRLHEKNGKRNEMPCHHTTSTSPLRS
jgi:integrase/recombinase XerD